MKRHFLLIFWMISIVVLVAPKANAQLFKWIKGGGTSIASIEQEQVNFICADPTGNTYASSTVGSTGIKADTFYKATSYNSQAPYILLTSYRCDGTMRWAHAFDGSGSARCVGLKYYNGSIYIAGSWTVQASNPNTRFIGSTSVPGHEWQDGFLAKLDSLGNVSWVQFVGQNVANTSIINSLGSLEIDAQGNIHRFVQVANGVKLSPTVTSVQGIYDMIYDQSGTLLRSFRLDNTDTFSLEDQKQTVFKKSSVAINNRNGNIYVMLYSQYQSRLCAYSSTGTLLWYDTTRTTSYAERSVLWDVYYDGNNGIYTSGNGSNGKFGIQGAPVVYNLTNASGNLSVIVKVDTNGIPKWIYANEHNSTNGYLSCTKSLPDGSIVAAGLGSSTINSNTSSLSSPGGGQNSYYTIVDTSGRLIKMDYLYGNGTEYFSALATDPYGNMCFGGYVSDSVKTPGGNYYKNTGGASDFFITRLGYNCGCTSNPVAGFTNGAALGKTVTYTYSGSTPADSLIWSFGDGQKLKVTTGFTAPVSHTYPSNAIYNACVTCYSGCGTNTYCKIAPLAVNAILGNEEVRVYPNPADDYLLIKGASGCIATMCNAFGQQLLVEQIISQNQSVHIGDLPAGVYILRLRMNNSEKRFIQVVRH